MLFLKKYKEYKDKYEESILELEKKEKEIKELQSRIKNIEKESEEYLEFYNKYSPSVVKGIVEEMKIENKEITTQKKRIEELERQNMLFILEKERELNDITEVYIENM